MSNYRALRIAERLKALNDPDCKKRFEENVKRLMSNSPNESEWTPGETFQKSCAPNVLSALMKDSDKTQALLACKIFWQTYSGVVTTTTELYFGIGRHILSFAKVLHSETNLFVQHSATRTGQCPDLKDSTVESNADSFPKAESVQHFYKKMVAGLEGQDPSSFILATALMYLTTVRFANGTRDKMSAYYAGAGRTLLKKLHLFPLLVPPPQKSFYDLLLKAMRGDEYKQLMIAVIFERETTTSSVVREYLDETCLSALSGYGLGLIVWLKRASARLGWSNDKLVRSLWFGQNVGAMTYVNKFLQDADRDPYVYYARLIDPCFYPCLNIKMFKSTALTCAMIAQGIDQHPERYPGFAPCSYEMISEAQKDTARILRLKEKDGTTRK